MAVVSGLSVVIISKNEENHIEDCLKSVSRIADEIVVIDSGSTDATIQICQQYTDQVISHPFETLGKQKQFALEQATKDWVLSLDADERISPELAEEIIQVKTNAPGEDYAAYYLPYRNHFGSKPLLQDGEVYSQIRLFKRMKGRFTPDVVHESIIVEGKSGSLEGLIYHYSYKSISQVMRKFTWYAQNEAEKMFNHGEKFSWIRMIKAPLSIFRYRYFIQQGIKDGWAGFCLSLLFSYYHLASHWYLRKLTGNQTNG